MDLAHTVGMRAVGEGVETPEQLAQLREMGCDMVQGFYFWKPLPAEAATQLLAAHPRGMNGHEGRGAADGPPGP